MKYVASLTTIPSRLEYVSQTLDSLANQTKPFEKIYLCVPYESKRLGKPYVIPDNLMSRKDIEIIRCQDYGPATKILGLLSAKLPEIEPETKIFFCDDDRVYDSNRAEQFYTASEAYPEFVICMASTPYWKFFVDNTVYDYNSDRDYPAGRHQIRDGFMDIFEGFGGVLVKPRFFDQDVYAIPREFSVVDDIWLSGQIKKSGRKIWGLNMTVPPTHKADSMDPLYNLKGDFDRKICNPKCIAYFRKAYSIWNNVEALSLDNNIPIPSIPNHQRLQSLLKPILEFLEIPSPPQITTQKPDSYIKDCTETIEDYQDKQQVLEKIMKDLITDCDKFSVLLQNYATASTYFKENGLLNETIQKQIESPINKALEETKLKSRIEEYLPLFQEVRSKTIMITIFQKRLFCNMCKKHIFHFVLVPCGHLSCDECRGQICKVCSKPVSSVQPVAF
jgi:hypothetical protein